MANVSDPPSNPEGLSKNAQKRRLKEEKKAKEKAEKAAAKAEAAKNAPVAAKATPVPSEHLEAASSSEAETALLPALERYMCIARRTAQNSSSCHATALTSL